jgi:hypothetical protein
LNSTEIEMECLLRATTQSLATFLPGRDRARVLPRSGPRA